MENTVKIPLGHGRFAMIDEADFPLVGGEKWFYCTQADRSTGYAIRRKHGEPKSIIMHRVITGCPIGMQVDHINGNGLDNRRANLRICTQSENLRNRRKTLKPKSSEYKGVSRPTGRKRFRAQIKADGVVIYLGHFISELDAARAYNAAAVRIHGDFASINAL